MESRKAPLEYKNALQNFINIDAFRHTVYEIGTTGYKTDGKGVVCVKLDSVEDLKNPTVFKSAYFKQTEFSNGQELKTSENLAYETTKNTIQKQKLS